MYELCALLRQPKTRKPRKVAAKRIGIGNRVWIGYGIKQGVVVERHPNGRWWNVRVDDMEGLHGFDRSIMKAV